MKSPVPKKPDPRQESVWDYPRPPALEVIDLHIRVVFISVVVAETRSPAWVKETSHPPVYFVPSHDARNEHLRPVRKVSYCEWKGQAIYYDLLVGDRRAKEVASSYPSPVPRFEPIRGWISFYAGPWMK